MVSNQLRILVADDEESILNVLRDTFQMADFHVLPVHDGQEAWEQVPSFRPDVIVLDLQMPRMSGTDVCERLKAHLTYRHIPVLLLTGCATTQDKVSGLEHGADDYLTKPFDVEELLARIRTLLRRSSLGLEANPLTRLPGNVSIEKELLNRIAEQERFSVLYIDLNHFKAYNDTYGFVKGDAVIRKTADIVLEVCHRDHDFIGHIGGDDFIVISRPERAEALCKGIAEKFDAASPSFYNDEDRAKGYVITKDRRGLESRFPLLSLSIGVVSNQHRSLSSLGEISKIGAEMKHFAKEQTTRGSRYAFDRRLD